VQVSQMRLYFPQVPSHPDPLQGLHLSRVAMLVTVSVFTGTVSLVRCIRICNAIYACSSGVPP
jgi:hypothetical protein